jgi:hypothetical protein
MNSKYCGGFSLSIEELEALGDAHHAWYTLLPEADSIERCELADESRESKTSCNFHHADISSIIFNTIFGPAGSMKRIDSTSSSVSKQSSVSKKVRPT